MEDTPEAAVVVDVIVLVEVVAEGVVAIVAAAEPLEGSVDRGSRLDDAGEDSLAPPFRVSAAVTPSNPPFPPGRRASPRAPPPTTVAAVDAAAVSRPSSSSSVVAKAE